MPSFNIHLAIAKQYLKKHKNEINNIEDFYNGTIRPDLNSQMTGLCEDKSKTHYGQMGNKNNGKFETNIYEFLHDSNVDINKDFYKGYLLHLLTDYYFYNKYFNKEFLELIQNNDKFHYDFDCINQVLEEKYELELTENLKKYTGYENDGVPKYLKLENVIDFIEDMSNIDLNEQIDIINRKELY